MGKFELGHDVLCVYGVDAKFVECRYNKDFILYYRHEFLVALVMRHVDIVC